MEKNMNLTEGKLTPVLLKFTVPILLSLLLQVTYGTVDLLIVGKFSSINDVSGVTIGSQVTQTITSFCTGLSMGTTVLVGRYIGRKEPDKTTKTIGVSIALFTSMALLITVFMMVCPGLIAGWMQTPEESFAQARSYLFFSGLGTLFIVFYNLIGSVFRGIGDSKTPLISVAIACIVNIIMDLILVAGLNLGATGAAIATTFAQGVSVVVCFMMIRKKPLPFKFSKSSIGFDPHYSKRLIKIGIPIALQSVLVSVSFCFVIAIINVFGVAASAAVGIVAKITGIVMVVPSAFNQSLAAFTAQCYGANKIERAKKALFIGMGISLVIGFIMGYLAAFHGTMFTRIFTDDEETTIAAILYLRSFAIDTVFVAIMFSITGFFNGCGKTTFVMLQSVLAAFCIRIPLAYVFSNLENTNMFLIGLATPLATLAQIFACIIFYFYLKKTILKQGYFDAKD